MGFPAQSSSLISKELKVLTRDRQALVLLFVMPAAFILFLSFALEDIFGEKIGRAVPLVLESGDDGRAAVSVLDRLRARPEFRIVSRGSSVEDRELFATGTAKAAIRIPRGFSEDLDSLIANGGRGEFGPHRIVWSADPTLDATYRWFLKASIATAVQGAILDRLAQTREGVRDAVAARADPDSFTSAAPAGPEARILPTPLQQTVPGWSLFAMFFIVVPLAGSFIRERQEGTLRRLLTYPVSRGAIVLGKLIPYLLVNVLQFATMLAVGLFLVPFLGDLSLQLGAHPWHLVPVTIAAALAATGFGVLVASLSRTIEQASALGSTAVVIMAVAGGVMVPVFWMPVFMQRAAWFSPLYWGHQAYLDVLLREASFSVVAPKLAVLLIFATIFFLIASWRMRRLV